MCVMVFENKNNATRHVAGVLNVIHPKSMDTFDLTYIALLVNITTILAVIFALVLLDSKKQQYSLFVFGLFVVLLSGIIGVFSTELAMRFLPEFMSDESGLFILSTGVGLVHATGLVMCIIAFHRRVKDV